MCLMSAHDLACALKEVEPFTFRKVVQFHLDNVGYEGI